MDINRGGVEENTSEDALVKPTVHRKNIRGCNRIWDYGAIVWDVESVPCEFDALTERVRFGYAHGHLSSILVCYSP